MKKGLLGLITGVMILTLALPTFRVFANDEYPTHTSTSDVNGITMTNTASWEDKTHANNNYNALLDITINGLIDKKTFNEPIDLQIVHDISTSMDFKCYRENHVSFTYYKETKDVFTQDQLTELRPIVTTYLLDKLKTEDTTTKDDWLSIAGKTDKDGYVFSNNAYLVPMNSFYMKQGNLHDEKVLSSDIPETRYWVIDNPVASKDDVENAQGYPYYYEKYHASVDEGGIYHSLSKVQEPMYPAQIHYGFFDRETAIYGNCKSYTTTAHHLMKNFANELYLASSDTHISINSFSDTNRYTSNFTNSIDQFDYDMVRAFNANGGQTNYEAGLAAGRDSLETHGDNDGRKKIIIFISDGRPNRSLDDDGNIVESSDMDRLTKIADKIKERNTEIYTVGFCIDKWTNDTYLLPMATDEDHSHFRTPDQLDNMVDIYDLIQKRVIEDTYIKSTVENTISKYYTVDKDKLPSDITLIEENKTLADGTTRLVQKIRYNVKTADLDKDGIHTKTVPLILKEEYRNTNEYYPTNDQELKGSNAVYENLDATKHNIGVDTPWLSVNAKTEKTYKIITTVVNGTITETITDIKSGGNKEIKYSPNKSYVLESIVVDGVHVDIEKFHDTYHFMNINSNHEIRVVYKKQNVDIPSQPQSPSNPSKPTDTPSTGDTAHMNLYLLLVCATGLLAIKIIKQRKRIVKYKSK